MKKNEVKEGVKAYFDSCKPFKCMGELLDGARLYDLKGKIYLQLGGRYAITKDCGLAYTIRSSTKASMRRWTAISVR